ncbi:MAG: MBL fold metallo-hydrolase [Bacteroidota bacterium]
MGKLIILGSSNAVPSGHHENTHMVFVGDERMVLVDCSGNPILRLQEAGLDFNDLTDVVITHFHPDHVSGLPLLLMDMWLMGRKKPLDIYGLHHTLERVEDLMRSFNWADWPDFYPVAFHHLPASERSAVLDCSDFRVLSSPVRHLIPAIGLRFDFHKAGKAVAYSGDTEPCVQVVRLAEAADILIHEAGGEHIGHSSAAQAAQIAARAEVSSLFLIHYPTGNYAGEDLVAQACQKYEGPVALATDFMVLNF